MSILVKMRLQVLRAALRELQEGWLHAIGEQRSKDCFGGGEN
jgi:hypothetical protein